MKIKKVEKTIYVISDLKTEEINKLAKHGKNIITDESGKQVFCIAYGPSKLSKNLVVFDTTMDSGKAAIEFGIVENVPEGADVINDFVENNAQALTAIQSYEDSFIDALADITAVTNAIIANVETIVIDEA